MNAKIETDERCGQCLSPLAPGRDDPAVAGIQNHHPRCGRVPAPTPKRGRR